MSKKKKTAHTFDPRQLVALDLQCVLTHRDKRSLKLYHVWTRLSNAIPLSCPPDVSAVSVTTLFPRGTPEPFPNTL